MRWLIPRWGEFQAQHPDITVHLVAGGGAVDWGSGMDLAIRRNDFDWGRSTHAVPLCAEQIGPVCQPQKLAQFLTRALMGATRCAPARLCCRARPGHMPGTIGRKTPQIARNALCIKRKQLAI